MDNTKNQTNQPEQNRPEDREKQRNEQQRRDQGRDQGRDQEREGVGTGEKNAPGRADRNPEPERKRA